jgi:predicted ATP-grasp superfamily ATP-dependent carboligase
MRSRYLARGLVRAANEAAVIDQLAALGEELGRACLFAISENDIEMLNRHQARLGMFRFMFADAERMASVLNKDRTYAAAARVGIRTPRTEAVTSAEQVRGNGLRYPVVLKWANPHEVMRTLSQAGLELEKTHYCHSEAELLAYLKRFERAGVYPLVQEYCAGYGLGQFILMQDGQAHYTFQHKRVHEWPPEGGVSTLCESLPRSEHQAQMDKSIALLRDLGWQGVAMVEYRYDPATGEAALMEINGRFWGSLPLAYHAGAAFPTLCYRLLGNGQPVHNAPYRSGMRCRYMIPETKRLLRILLRPHQIADKQVRFRRLPELFGFCLDFLRPASRYYVFSLADPQPFFSDIGQGLRKALKAVLPARS